GSARGSGVPLTVTTSTAGSASVASSRTTVPLTATRPSVMSRSAPRRDVSPACARTLFSRSLGMRDALPGRLSVRRGLRMLAGHVGNDELSFHPRQVVEIAKPERDQELPRRLVQKGTPRGVLASRDADEPALHQAVEHALGVHAADGVDLRTGH